MLKPPLYDITKSYLENAEKGPFFSGEIEKRELPEEALWHDFLGYKVASKIGVSAGPLLNARWVALAADLGYDILTYKTIRSKEAAGHPTPNMIYVESNSQLAPGRLPTHLTASLSPPADPLKIAVTNSFGMPSRSPEYLAEDIPRALASLQRGQVMVVSVVGTPSGNDPRLFFDDFVKTARQAVEYGAPIVEANFSCPNVATGGGELYKDKEAVAKLTKALANAIGDIPLIVKVGAFEEQTTLEETLIAAARGGARGVCGINTISMKVKNHSGAPALGEARPTSGICGYPIFDAALSFTEMAKTAIEKHNLELTLMTTGGALTAAQLEQFIDRGAFAMTATGMMWDPYLAATFHNRQKERLYAAT